jgi:hypothetical protein
MTITVKYKTDRKRWDQTTLFKTDKDDVATITFDYSGELGSDTISTATASSENITIGTPSISSNVVTATVSAGQEGSTAKMELNVVTTGGLTIPTNVRFKVSDYYENI